MLLGETAPLFEGGGGEGKGAFDAERTANITPIDMMIEAGLKRVEREVEVENGQLEAMIRAIETPPPSVDLTNVEWKINATGLTLEDWLRITEIADSPMARRMWAADYDAIEVMYVNRGSLPDHQLSDPPPPLPVESPPFPPNTIGAIIVDGSPSPPQLMPASSTRRFNRKVSRRAPATNHEPIASSGISMRRISARQQELLGQLVIDGDLVVFGPDDHIDDWDALKVVMELLGAKWKMGRKGKGMERRGGFRFPDGVDVAETIRLAKVYGEVFDPKKVGFYATADDVADDLVRRASLGDLEAKLCRPPHVLEPSAGTGNLVRAILRAHPSARVSCVELLQSNRDELVRLDCSIIGTDFLSLSPTSLDPFDAAIMNPPFGGGGDAKHVLHAIKFVRPSRPLSAIISPGIEHRSSEPFMMLRQWIERHGGGKVEIPAGAFAQAGTNVCTYMIWGRVCEGCGDWTCVKT